MPQQAVVAAPQGAVVAGQQQTGVPMTIKDMLRSDSIKKRFEELLGSKAAGFLSSVLSISNTPQLRGANPNTIMSAAAVAATLDLPINQNLGYAYIVPYKNKDNLEAQFQMGWRGFYQLALRSGVYKTITSNEVYEGEVEIVNRFTEEIKFGPRKSDKIVGYLAYYKTNAGTEKYFYMPKEAVEAHAKKYSQSYRKDKCGTSQWAVNFDAMAKKTVLKLLLSKYGELSIQQQLAQKFDQAVINNASTDVTNVEKMDVEYVDNIEEVEVVEESVAETANNVAESLKAKKAAAMESASIDFDNQK